MSNESEQLTTELATRTAKSASFIVSGKFISILIQVLMFIVVARLLLPNYYGVYTVVLSVAAFISAFGSLNIGTYFNERIPFLIAKKRAHEIGVALGDGIVAVIIPGLLLFLIGAVASSYLSSSILHCVPTDCTSYTLIMILAMSSIVFTFLYSTLNLILVGFQDGKNSGIALIIYSLVQAGLSIALIEAASYFYPNIPEAKIAGAIGGYIIALLVASVFQLLVASRRSKIIFTMKGMWKRIKEMLKFSMPLTYTNITQTLVTNFAVIILASVALSSAVGFYGIANRIGTLIDVVAGSISVVLIPMFAEAINSRHINHKVGKFFYYSIYFGLLFTTPMIVYVVVFSHPLITTLFSAAYAGASFYMQLTGIGLLIGIFGTFAMQLVISTRETNKVFKYSLIVGIVEVVSLLVLVPTHIIDPVIGVIIATLYIGGIATNVLFMNYLRKMGITIKYTQPIKVVIANVIVAVLISLLFLILYNNSVLLLVVGFVITLLIYPPILAKVGAITKDDIALITKISQKLPIASLILKVLLAYTLFFI